MMKRLPAFGLAALLLASVSARADMYAVDWDINSADSNLYRLNATTGAATLIGDTGVVRLIGLGESSNGTLYSINESDVGPPSNLYTINPTTGAATLVGSTGVNFAEGDLAIDPSTGTLYANNSSGDHLFQIDPTTGNATQVGTGITGRDISGMLFSGGTLFGLALNDASPDTFNTIDTTTGVGTSGPASGTNFGVVAALGSDPTTGLIYAGGPLTNFGSDNELYSTNLATTGTPIAITGITHSLSGLAPAAVPEPSGMVLAALGIIGLGGLRRANRRPRRG